MKYIVWTVRSFVGVLFIISGLIKLNDPVGFSFKLEEYFSQGVLNLPFLIPWALAIALTVVIVEVLLGVLLLLGFKSRVTLWSLLTMLVFFTFLTFYSAYFNKVTDCGCFGDAIPLTPWESFTKDVVLLVLILVLFWGRKYIQPLFSAQTNWVLSGIALLACAGLAYYVLHYLPVIDFRPYAIGKNIQEGMRVPEEAPKSVYEYAWQFKGNGVDTVVVTYGDYPTMHGDFVGVKTTQIQKGYEPPIHDFTMEKEGHDATDMLLEEEKLLIVVAYDLAKSDEEVFPIVAQIATQAQKKGYTVVGLTASSNTVKHTVQQQYGLPFDFYFTDETTLKTVIRANPGVLVLERGTIQQKVHHNAIHQLNL